MTTRARFFPVMLTAMLMGACTATTTPQPDLSKGSTYFIPNIRLQEVRRDVMGRYRCMGDLPMTCQCTSRIAATCECSCVPPIPVRNRY